MADDKDTSAGQNTDTQGSPKLIAGKYKTVEEAEAAILEKDRTISRFGQENAGLKRQLDERSRPAKTSGQGTGDEDPENEQLAQSLLVNPKAVLANVVSHAVQLSEERASAQVTAALTIERFVSTKPLISKHLNLFRSYLSQTDAEKPLNVKLAEAYQQMETELAAAVDTGKKQADAERKHKDKAGAIVLDEGTGAPAKKKDEEEEIDTPESYMAERKASVERLRAAI